MLAALDIRDGKPAVSGWVEIESTDVEDLVRRWNELPLAGVVLTATERDGTLGGPDLEALTQLNLEYIRSVNHRDVDWFDRYLSADFLNANPDCSIVDRADFLKQIARGAGVSNIEAEDVRIKVIRQSRPDPGANEL